MMYNVPQWIRESNLIEGIDDPVMDYASLRAWMWLRGQHMSEQSILLTHSKIINGSNERIAGKFRTCGVYVGNYVAPDWWKVPSLIEGWLRVHGGAKTEENIKAAHIAFENIHPFEDGNGRTGRMLMNNQRLLAGLEPLCIRAYERWDYYRWFEEGRK